LFLNISRQSTFLSISRDQRFSFLELRLDYLGRLFIPLFKSFFCDYLSKISARNRYIQDRSLNMSHLNRSHDNAHVGMPGPQRLGKTSRLAIPKNQASVFASASSPSMSCSNISSDIRSPSIRILSTATSPTHVNSCFIL